MTYRPLTIVATNAGTGVVLSQTSDAPYEEYRIQLVDITETEDGLRYEAGWVGLFNAGEICRIGFCENDHEQGVILCAAAGIATTYGRKYSVDFQLGGGITVQDDSLDTAARKAFHRINTEFEW